MNAKELFDELGYTNRLERKNDKGVVYAIDFEKVSTHQTDVISFGLYSKTVQPHKTFNVGDKAMWPISLTFDEAIAIVKQMEELGWLK